MRQRRALLLTLLVGACGGGDSGTNAPPPPPVVSVQIIGTPRVKVGDQYQFSVEARTAEGTIAQRPVNWSLPSGGGSITSAGTLIASTTGSIVLQASVEGVNTSTQVEGYDWRLLSNGVTSGAFLASDAQITNRGGQSEFPELVIGCTSGSFIVAVFTDRFITSSGVVQYAFGSGAATTATWIESNDFTSLIFPGLTNLAQKNFAQQIAATAQFTFVFREFQGDLKPLTFRASGLNSRLTSLLAACPSNNLRANDALASTPAEALRALRTLAASHP